MGGGSYSYDNAVYRSVSSGYATKSTIEVFKQRSINNAMSPYGVKIRESRDSAEHPESYPIIINLDVTGSMGSIPHFIVKEGLPNIMKKIMEAGIKHPQILFNAIGDHTCDDAPLQVGQFESSDDLLDHWLTTVWIEGHGGGNEGESYLLAWYFAANHTSTDSFEKRNKKGVCITIGDEPTLDSVSSSALREIMGDAKSEYGKASTNELLEKAQKAWACYHIHVAETRAGQDTRTQNGWKELMRDYCLFLKNKEEIDDMIADIVIKEYQKDSNWKPTKTKVDTTEVDKSETVGVNVDKEDIYA